MVKAKGETTSLAIEVRDSRRGFRAVDSGGGMEDVDGLSEGILRQ